MDRSPITCTGCFDPATGVHDTLPIERDAHPAPPKVVVVGAGIAGLTAARTLVEAGFAVLVVDKGRSVGGRLATRRIGGARLDHGAQFFTVRTDEFGAVVARAERAGVVHEWCRGFSPDGDGYPRYAARNGLNHLGKYLAEGLDVTLDTRIDAAEVSAGRWHLRSDADRFAADAVVLTAPMPQSLDLLDAGGIDLETDLRNRLDAVAYHPTLALLVVLDGNPGLPPPGGVQLTDGPFSFIADNEAKGASAEHAITFHVSPERSTRRWNDDDDRLRADLLTLARPWLGDAEPTEVQLKRWRYAQPVAPATHAFEATVIDGAPLAFAGDAFAGARVEGAFLSGLAVATHLTSAIRPS
jgi:predicted NAD/FAD-dependent oxidoreductase